jgi:hypothetical protein
MTERIRAILLCEDRQQEVFARTFLQACDIHPLRVRIAPYGRGAGEQFVRQNYPAEVREYRGKAHAQPGICLVVMCDADTLTVAERRKRLEDALAEQGITAREDIERIGIFIPRRNVETWIYFLKGQVVDEQTVYPHLGKESECKPDVERLAHNRRTPLPENAPPSLHTACQEFTRIQPAKR